MLLWFIVRWEQSLECFTFLTSLLIDSLGILVRDGTHDDRNLCRSTIHKETNNPGTNLKLVNATNTTTLCLRDRHQTTRPRQILCWENGCVRIVITYNPYFYFTSKVVIIWCRSIILDLTQPPVESILTNKMCGRF